ncbi:MAG: tRNA threonylcarbamoyladenosine biosynthesis protein TsaB [Syntrophorhabdaceae bacterium PtaU1.Bin034]|jgi:tRNA threonylcarbamoyladenosine biosynthesis protein TsaB|nr:MAG: tRNA threonylcarbamoyladenosine biosynthesis protein TsaB [Syntrophorhabdaceae bacterium PtaU1.Bin034]
MQDKLVLGLDNSLDFLNLVLARNDQLIEERHAKAEQHSSQVLPDKVSQLLADHGYTPKDVSTLIVSLGPGSFTGVRVGLAFCKGMAEALGIPLIGVPTQDILAQPFGFLAGYYLCPLIDAKKGEVFFALYRVEDGTVVRIDGFHALKPDQLRDRVPEPCLCFGSGVKLCRSVLTAIEGVRLIEQGFDRVSGEALLRTGLARRITNGHEDVAPLYGRKSEAEIKFNITVS